jgi:hypothetical protein
MYPHPELGCDRDRQFDDHLNALPLLIFNCLPIFAQLSQMLTTRITVCGSRIEPAFCNGQNPLDEMRSAIRIAREPMPRRRRRSSLDV